MAFPCLWKKYEWKTARLHCTSGEAQDYRFLLTDELNTLPIVTTILSFLFVFVEAMAGVLIIFRGEWVKRDFSWIMLHVFILVYFVLWAVNG